MDATMMALFVENNIELTPDWYLTPGLRLDHHDQFGANWSPSLNTSYKLTPDVTLKAGIACAFKAPNLYQSNPNYLYRSNGNGCAPTAAMYWVTRISIRKSASTRSWASPSPATAGPLA